MHQCTIFFITIQNVKKKIKHFKVQVFLNSYQHNLIKRLSILDFFNDLKSKNLEKLKPRLIVYLSHY